MTEQSGGTTAEAQPLTPGKLLRRERERRALSVQQAAEDLHLDASTVEAIEDDRFVALGAPVYAKGHLRKYATLLGLSADDVIRRYEALGDTPIVADPIPATVAAPAQRPRPSLKVPIWIVVAVIAASIGWWLYQEFSSNPAGDVLPPPSVAPQVIEPEATANVQPQPGPAAPSSEATAPAEPASATPERASATRPEPAAATASEPAATPTAEPVRVRLEFNDSSWTEIVDATGRRLMIGTGEPGQVRTLQGVPPIRVTFGLASAVDMQVNDRPTLVPRRAGKDSARFVIEADGAVR
jgi:cytoskeleton protein RodZ